MVHLSRIPRELIAVMKQRLQQETPATSTAPAVSVTVGHTDDSSTGNSSKSATTESSAEAADGTAVHEQTSKDTAEGVGAPRVWSNPTTAAIEDATATAAASKKRSSSNKETTSGASADSLTSDLESLFSPGDVVKVRVQSVDLAARRVELSMQPYRQGEKDGKNGSGDGGVRGMQEGEYMVEGRDPEGEESRYEEERRAAEEELALQSRFDPEDTLLWWRAQPYVKTSTLQRVAAMKRGEEEAVMAESSQIVDGTWRRLFELDMRQDAADFSNKGYDAEMKEIADEIGELAGLDEDLYTTGRFDTSDYQNKVKFGAFVDSAIFPAAWRDELDFFQRLEEREKEINEKLRGGKKYDLAEFEAAMRQAQMRATEQTSRMSRGTGSRSSGGSEGSGDGGENVRVWTSTSLSTPSSVVPAEETTVPVSAHNVDEISQGVDSKAVSEPSD